MLLAAATTAVVHTMLLRTALNKPQTAPCKPLQAPSQCLLYMLRLMLLNAGATPGAGAQPGQQRRKLRQQITVMQWMCLVPVRPY